MIKDFSRYNFQNIRTKSINDISIWYTPVYNIIEREKRLNYISVWLENNKDFLKKEKELLIDNNFLSSEKITQDIYQNNNNKKDCENLFSLFNKKKYLSYILSDSYKNITKVISLRTYVFLSLIFIEKFIKTQDIQYFNTALKINDFLFSCQIKSKNNKTNACIPDFFPSYFNGFHISYSTNELFLEAVSKELSVIKKIKNNEL